MALDECEDGRRRAVPRGLSSCALFYSHWSAALGSLLSQRRIIVTKPDQEPELARPLQALSDGLASHLRCLSQYSAIQIIAKTLPRILVA